MSLKQQDNIYTKMIKQPILNIGCLGSVSDGKSTTIRQLTGIKTQRHSNEEIRNITIKPGYANMKVWHKGGIYTTTSSDEKNDGELVHHLSFVDCPGHQELILTMMSSVSLMKGAIIIVSAAEPINKKPQLIQHLAAAKISGLDKIIIIFNKLDLISKDKALERKEELDILLEKLNIKPKYIIPTALNKKLGLDNVVKAIMEVFPPELSLEDDAKTEFKITRSFDVNKPGINWDKIQGGIFGGSLISGKLKIGDKIEIRPGQWSKDKNGKFIVNPIQTTISSIQSDKIKIDDIIPGGLIAIGSDIDPFYCKDDKLAGSIVGHVSCLPNIYQNVNIILHLTNEFDGDWKPKKNEIVFIQNGNINIQASLTDFKNDNYTFSLSKPTCVNDNALILICINIDRILKIVAFGNFKCDKNVFI
jgi:translation initiation factor 2 subunit 3